MSFENSNIINKEISFHLTCATGDTSAAIEIHYNTYDEYLFVFNFLDKNLEEEMVHLKINEIDRMQIAKQLRLMAGFLEDK